MATKKKPELPHRLANDLASNIPEVEYCTRFKHSVNLGDLYAAMGTMKKFYEMTQRKVAIAQVCGQIAAYYPGAEHPTKNAEGQAVCMNDEMWTMVKPLVESQEYIHSIEKYEGQHIDIDLDVIRGKTNVNLPHGAIQNWVPFAWPDLAFDLSKPWIILNGECPDDIKKQVKGKAILNFTERYRNQLIDYFFLKNYVPDLIFAGTEREHWLFCNRWQLSIPRLEIKDFLELGYAIKESRFLLSNQSQAWNLADAMKTPRILEVCNYAENCITGIGEDSYGFFYNTGVEYYWRLLYNKTHNK